MPKQKLANPTGTRDGRAKKTIMLCCLPNSKMNECIHYEPDGDASYMHMAQDLDTSGWACTCNARYHKGKFPRIN